MTHLIYSLMRVILAGVKQIYVCWILNINQTQWLTCVPWVSVNTHSICHSHYRLQEAVFPLLIATRGCEDHLFILFVNGHWRSSVYYILFVNGHCERDTLSYQEWAYVFMWNLRKHWRHGPDSFTDFLYDTLLAATHTRDIQCAVITPYQIYVHI